MNNEPLCVGEVLRPQGLRGELKVNPRMDDPRRFLALRWVLVAPDFRQVAVQGARVQGDFVYLKLEGVNDRDEAERWRQRRLYVQRKDAEPLEKNAYYIVDLVGCVVEDRWGKALGEVVDVLQPGANDVYVVRGEHELLIPAIRQTVLKVDIENKRIVINEESLLSEEVDDAH